MTVLGRAVIYALIFFFVLNGSNIGKGKRLDRFAWVLPLSLGIALGVVESFFKLAFYSGFLIFLIITLICFFTFRFMSYSKK
jgi:hypothetical protein